MAESSFLSWIQQRTLGGKQITNCCVLLRKKKSSGICFFATQMMDYKVSSQAQKGITGAFLSAANMTRGGEERCRNYLVPNECICLLLGVWEMLRNTFFATLVA
ncbi:unnamed protein product [Cladocopium goreaui]|uniref:Uncharacterized protein n=1 Tax=Cladocopium goreaui TaxID=2562237 RepID=A0A9P1DFK8_9DINO|nr:unnamed protein product [Cladocopium goreaui]